MGGEWSPGLNFMQTLRTIEKYKETIVNRPNKVMGPATGLFPPEVCNSPNQTIRSKTFLFPPPVSLYEAYIL